MLNTPNNRVDSKRRSSMLRFKNTIAHSACALVLAAVFPAAAAAQSATSPARPIVSDHLDFDRPESWALKYFTSSTMLSGLRPPDTSPEGTRLGSITVGFELGWMPELDAGQRRVGFYGTKIEDLSKAPIFARPVVRVGLPWKFTAIAAAPVPASVFGVKPRLFAL